MNLFKVAVMGAVSHHFLFLIIPLNLFKIEVLRKSKPRSISPLAFNVFLIGFNKQFKIGLRMKACRALL